MKIVSFVFLICLSSLPGRTQVTQADLESHLLHKPLILRGLYAGDHLAFNSQGEPASIYRPAPLTLSGLDIHKVQVKGNVAEIQAERTGLLYDAKVNKFHSVQLHEKRVQISLDLTGITDSAALLDKIFTTTPASIGAGLPPYWQPFFHVPDPAIEKSQVAKINDPKFQKVFKPEMPAVTTPVVLSRAEPEFSEEARRARISGVCMINMIVDANGLPRHVAIQQPVGLGLEEKAVEAVSKYRFTPAMQDGKPVAVNMTAEVAFLNY